ALVANELIALACAVLDHVMYSDRWHPKHVWADTKPESTGPAAFPLPSGKRVSIGLVNFSTVFLTASLASATNAVAGWSSGIVVSRPMKRFLMANPPSGLR